MIRGQALYNHDESDFPFIGPDKEDFPLQDVQQYIRLFANIIEDTGQPNYKLVRLTLQTPPYPWDKYLHQYNTSHFRKYLQFGFFCPLMRGKDRYN